MTIKAKKSKINLREKLAELLNFRQIRDRLDGLGLYLGKDRTGTSENLAVRGGANIDDLQLAEISAALGDTAVDVFVYDTRNDSDGGKWREHTGHTSWYNEELNTSTRGGRREFPAVAVIVAEAGKVTIYDGDDPDLSMWKIIVVSGDNLYTAETSIVGSGGDITCISFLNGILAIGSATGNTGTQDMNGITRLNFLSDSVYGTNKAYTYKWNGSLGATDDQATWTLVGAEIKIIDNDVNDVAMTVLPNAPIDSDTGLPVPTIAVATDGGVSVIKDDGSVVDSTSPSTWHRVSFYNSVLYGTLDGNPSPIYIVENYLSNGFIQSARIYPNSAFNTSDSGVALLANAVTDESEIKVLNDIAIGNVGGLTLVDDKEIKTTLHAYTTSSYNTGWMPGDIKLAALSDNTVETVGVDETDNLVNNGDFSTSSFDKANDGWYDQPGVSGSSTPWAISGGVASHAGDQSYLQQNNVFEIGKQYALTFTVTGTTVLPGSTGLTQSNVTFSNGTYTYVGTAIKTYLSFYSNTTTTIDNVSVTETGELITNGTFDTDSDWTKGAGWTISGGVASVNNTSGDFSSVQAFPTVEAGKHYVFTADVTTISAGSILLTYQSGSGYANIQAVSSIGISRDSSEGPGPLVRYFRADTSGVALLSIAASNTAIASVDNASFREIEFDRSVNNRGLKIFGQIDKTPVAPGADLVAYSGFSADDYLMQPYNPDLDFGTGDFCVMGWAKWDGVNAAQAIISRSSTDGQDDRIDLEYSVATNSWRLYTRASGTSVIVSGTTNAASGVWTHLVALRRNGVIELFLNGLSQGTATQAANLTDTHNSPTYIGIGAYGSNSFGGSIALARISATAPTDEQIAKIYQDERQLFTDGAQATLYGTSDAVTALAYDDKTELLHVGTSDGRSDFSGLRRINNTTTAVTTSISASNNLIAEQ